MCVHGGKSDPISRCIIISKCTGNDVICHRKSRYVLIDQSYVCLSLVGPIKGQVWGLVLPSRDRTKLERPHGPRGLGPP